jgi:hypothetical protein
MAATFEAATAAPAPSKPHEVVFAVRKLTKVYNMGEVEVPDEGNLGLRADGTNSPVVSRRSVRRSMW